MTRIAEGSTARARTFPQKTKGSTTLAAKGKRGWCCFCPGEAPPKAAGQDKTLRSKPAAPKKLVTQVSSGEAGSAPRIAPVPAYGPVSEARAFPKPEDAMDFRHWR